LRALDITSQILDDNAVRFIAICTLSFAIKKGNPKVAFS